jgi:hypothetical protein
MKYVKLFPAVLAVAAMSFVGATSAEAQARRGGGGAATRAVPRASVPGGRAIRPGIVTRGVVPYRPYYYPYGYGYPYGLSLGFSFGYPYYGYYGYPYGGYPYGYYGYPYGGYVATGPAYGGVRIEGAPRSAQVYADGYYVGVVDDFDGVFQHVDLTPGAHRIEIRTPNAPPISFDVRVQPGQTITYRADQPRN